MAIVKPPGYRIHDNVSLAGYLASKDQLAQKLGGQASAWEIKEVGDGNLNLVFIVKGTKGSLCVKQSLPYVRLVGESWPLPLERAFFEYQSSKIHEEHTKGLVPEIYFYDEKLFLIAMEYLSPHVILRQGMIKGVKYPNLANDLASYTANTLFYSSDLALDPVVKKQQNAIFLANTALCQITEDLIFTDPYTISDRNRWTSPQLDDEAEAIRHDQELIRAISGLKWHFMNHPQALLHGDLHTGSIMVTETDTRVIDPEFAFYGPASFDVGKFIGNLLLCYFSQRGHESTLGDRDDYRRWILSTIETFWHEFTSSFRALSTTSLSGSVFPKHLYDNEAGHESLNILVENVLDDLFEEAIGYAGCSMIRRTVGLAHNLDFEAIEDPDLRASCEKRNLMLAKELIKTPHQFESIEHVTAKAALIEEQPMKIVV